MKAHAEEVCSHNFSGPSFAARAVGMSHGRHTFVGVLGHEGSQRGPVLTLLLLRGHRLAAASSMGGSVTVSRTPTATCPRMACPA